MFKSILTVSVFLLANLKAAVLDDSFDLKQLTDKKIGYYVGSFDPFRHGHEKVVDQVLDNQYVDYILVYPAPGGDPYKNRSPFPLRQKMVASLYRDHPRVFITDWTPKELQDRFSTIAGDVEVIGIIGSDFVTEKLLGPDAEKSAQCRRFFLRGIPLKEEHYTNTYGALTALKADSFIVALRDDPDLSNLNGRVGDREIRGYVATTGGDSSTKVRAAIQRKERFEHLISDSVEAIIKQEGMYGYESESPSQERPSD